MGLKSYLFTAFLLGVVVALTLMAAEFELPYDTRLGREIQNAGHAPFFGVLSLLFLWLSNRAVGSRVNRRFWHYLIALAASAVLGATSEYLQIASPRDADIWDLARDVAGAVSFLGFHLILDRKMAPFWGKWARKGKPVIFAGCVLLIVSPFVPVALWAGAYLHRNQAFPEVCDFESYWGNMFLKTRNAALQVTDPPAGWKRSGSAHAARVTFSGATYPAFFIEEPYPDWRDYAFLRFAVYSELDTSVNLVLRIEDSHHDRAYEDRFNRAIVIRPGVNPISISLDDVRQAPATRDMDMAAVRALSLFAVRIKKPFTVYLDDFRLD